MPHNKDIVGAFRYLPRMVYCLQQGTLLTNNLDWPKNLGIRCPTMRSSNSLGLDRDRGRIPSRGILDFIVKRILHLMKNMKEDYLAKIRSPMETPTMILPRGTKSPQNWRMDLPSTPLAVHDQFVDQLLDQEHRAATASWKESRTTEAS